MAAITFTQLGQISGITTNATSYNGPSGVVRAGDMLICGVSASATVSTGTMTGGGLNWQKLIPNFTKNAGTDTQYIFWASSPTDQGLGVTFGCASDTAAGCCIYCYRVSGLEGQTSPSIRQYVTSIGTTANPSGVLLAPALQGNGCVGFAANGTNSATQWTAPTSWVEGGEATYATATNSFEAASISSGETRTVITWTNSNVTAWGVAVIELWNPRARATGGGMAVSSPMFY